MKRTMKSFYRLKWLLVFFLIPIGFVYAQAQDSSVLSKTTPLPKKKCCYFTVMPYQRWERTLSSEFPEYYNKSYDFNTTIGCDTISHGLGAINSMSQYGDETKTQKLPTSYSPKKIYKLSCVEYSVVCGFADSNIVTPEYNATTCK